MADKDIIEEALEDFSLCEDHESDNRINWEDDVSFSRDEDQWPAKIKQQRELEGRPCLTINKLGAFIRQVVNDARQNKPQANVHPVDSQGDPATAQVFNGLIRNIYATSDADVAHDTGIEHAVSGGFGYWRINTAYTSDDTFDQDITINRIANPLCVYGDYASSAADSSDWDRAFIVDTLTKDQFERRYKGAEAVDWKGDDYGKLGAPWIEGDTVMIAEYWTREETRKKIVQLSDGDVVEESVYAKNKAAFDAAGVTVVGSPREVASKKVVQRILTGAEELDKVEWQGRYIPIVPVYGDEVMLRGKRHFRSLIRSAKDAQRRYNYHQSTVTELIALAPKTPFIGRKGAFITDAAKWETANSDSHAYIEYDGPEAPSRQPYAAIPAGELQAALNASDDMKSIIGIYDAGLGARSNETSGKAINARQRESDVSTFHFIDNLSRAIRHEGRILIDLIPKVYSTDRIVRVLGQDGAPQQAVVTGEGPAVQQQPGPNGEMLNIYNLGAGKYDLTVKTGPSFTTQREAAVEAFSDIIRAFPPAAPVLADLIVKNMDIPNGEEAVKRLEALTQPKQPQQDPRQAEQVAQVMQQAQQLAQENAQLKQTAAADAQANALKAEELKVKMFEAQTKRIEAVTKATQPTQAPDAPRWSTAA